MALIKISPDEYIRIVEEAVVLGSEGRKYVCVRAPGDARPYADPYSRNNYRTVFFVRDNNLVSEFATAAEARGALDLFVQRLSTTISVDTDTRLTCMCAGELADDHGAH